MSYRKDYRSDKNGLGFSTTKERDEQMRDDMMRMMEVVEKNSAPKKRWWHFFIKPKQERIVIQYGEGTPVLSEQDKIDRQIFLEGYNEGRKDGDAHAAYKLWYRIKTNT